ncbi:MAG TPA: efflux RND transporter permease subunit [Candidatus Cloacimonas sp.]|nr:efflux RND transporter permease subunit [Candidatus Cloacimonas sp.]
MFLTDLSINRPVLVTMAIMVFIVFGVLAYFSLPINLMPDLKLPYVVVQTVYSGAGPREIESQVTEPIEEAVATVSQIDFIQSYSMENVSLVMVAFKLGKNIDVANQEVKDKVDAVIRNLPDGTDRPIVLKMDITAFPIMDLVLSGNISPKDLYELADGEVKDRLSQIPGVARVSLIGGAKRQIDVRLTDKVVFENKISLSQLSGILAAGNLDMPAGNFSQGTQEYSVRLKGEFQDVERIKNTDIPTAFGVKKLSQIARVEDATEEVRSKAIYFNVPENLKDDNIVRLSITNAADGNVVAIAEEITKQIPALNKELPEGVKLEIMRDDSVFTKDTINSTLQNILLGILFTGLILFIFLHDFRSTLIVAISMPYCIISTFVFMQIFGYSFNIMTMMGLSTSIGILVSNSVVVLENIFRHKDMGNTRKQASQIGTNEIGTAVLASTLTNIVVFLPIATMTSMVGRFFKEFAVTVTMATVFSLLTAFTITPMLASKIIPKEKRVSKWGKKFDNVFDKFGNIYAKFLSYTLRSKKTSVSILLFTLLALLISCGLAFFVGIEMIPPVDQRNLSISVEMPQGTNLEETAKTMDLIQNRVAKHKEVVHILTNLGSGGFIDTGTNLASSDIKLVDRKERKYSANQLVDILTKELADIPNAKIKVAGSTMGMGGGGNSAVQFMLEGQDNARLEQIKNEVVKSIENIPGLINLDTSSRYGRYELTLYPKRDKLAAAGATVYDLALALRANVEGLVSTQYRESGNQYDIKISLEDEVVDSPDKIKNLSVVVMGKSYLVSQLADVEFATGVNRLTHYDRYKTIMVTGDIASGYHLSDITSQIEERMNKINFPTGYRFEWGGQAKMMNETIVDMVRTFILAVILTYMLLAAILESFAQPILILATVPLALIGVILSLLITGYTFNIVSMMAIIMLVGIVVNNAILLMDYVNIKRREGYSVHDALMEAGKMKLKPIVMSTLAIIVGMLPMAIGIGSTGAEMTRPMGIVSIGGLIVSTFLTLIIIPAFYFLTTKNIHAKKESQ